MPITQDRFQAVIQEASDLWRTWEGHKTDLLTSIGFWRDSDYTKAEILQALEATIKGWQRPHMEWTAVEQAHFRKNARANEKMKLRMQRRRRAQHAQALWDSPKKELIAEELGDFIMPEDHGQVTHLTDTTADQGLLPTESQVNGDIHTEITTIVDYPPDLIVEPPQPGEILDID